MRLRWDGIIARLSYRFNFLAISPRDIRVIDPACGSGHFLLYCFLLLLIIYEEAWADQDSPESGATGRTLRADPLQTSPALSSFCALWMTSNGEVELGFCFG
jgi:type II restriction/modification system DNA methylase subunit YeeA